MFFSRTSLISLMYPTSFQNECAFSKSTPLQKNRGLKCALGHLTSLTPHTGHTHGLSCAEIVLQCLLWGVWIWRSQTPWGIGSCNTFSIPPKMSLPLPAVSMYLQVIIPAFCIFLQMIWKNFNICWLHLNTVSFWQEIVYVYLFLWTHVDNIYIYNYIYVCVSAVVHMFFLHINTHTHISYIS